MVTWDVPYGVDNSREPLNITEIHFYKSGDLFEIGAHIVTYKIEDRSGNRGADCSFLINIKCNIWFVISEHTNGDI